MEQHTHNSIAHDVLEKIQHKQITIHSKNFFRLKMIAFSLLIIAICVTSIVLCSFILFSIRMSGQGEFIRFGSQGILLFFAVFPWFLLLFDLLLIALLGQLMRHFSFGYKIPGVYIAGIIFTVIIIIGYILEAQTSFHRHMLLRADKKELPLFDDVYRGVRRAPPIGYEIYRGVVVFREGDMLYIDLDDEMGTGTSSSVIMNIEDNTEAPHIEQGDSVFISGNIVDGKILNARLKRAPRLPRPY